MLSRVLSQDYRTLPAHTGCTGAPRRIVGHNTSSDSWQPPQRQHFITVSLLRVRVAACTRHDARYTRELNKTTTTRVLRCMDVVRARTRFLKRDREHSCTHGARKVAITSACQNPNRSPIHDDDELRFRFHCPAVPVVRTAASHAAAEVGTLPRAWRHCRRASAKPGCAGPHVWSWSTPSSAASAAALFAACSTATLSAAAARTASWNFSLARVRAQ